MLCSLVYIFKEKAVGLRGLATPSCLAPQAGRSVQNNIHTYIAIGRLITPVLRVTLDYIKIGSRATSNFNANELFYSPNFPTME